ncbi:hypothetical protein BMJ34_00920 [Sinorhizobium medicae]|nr:hypothetical protein BMJ34_00920 [Sinorhizobium medicae]
MTTLAQDLSEAASVRTVTIPEATHYVHLDRPERRRGRLLAEVIRTLAQPAVAKAQLTEEARRVSHTHLFQRNARNMQRAAATTGEITWAVSGSRSIAAWGEGTPPMCDGQ